FLVGLCTSVVPLLVIPDYGIRLMVTTGLTGVVWLVVMLITPPESVDVMERFVRQVQPPGPGWRRWRERFDVEVVDSLGELIRRFLLSSAVLFGGLLGSGAFVLHQSLIGWLGLVVTVVCGLPLLRTYGLRLGSG
ncbi:MAG: sodium:proline symporter, partial [Synechococcus sp.]|nr:sodium:proline symporter [Synechococcus sp.]